VCWCSEHKEKFVLYFAVGLLIGGISVLLIVNVYLVVVLLRHRRQLRDLGVQPVTSRRRRRRRRRDGPPTSPSEAASFVDSGRPPSASPELSRRAVQRPRPSRRAPSPLEVVQPTTPTSPPGQVHIPPRDSPVFVHVESPRESPLLGRGPPAAPGAAGLLPPSVDVAPPPSDSTERDESPVWVRLQEAPPEDGTSAEPGRVVESPIWVHLELDDSASTTVSTTTAAPPGLIARPSPSVSPASTLGARPTTRRAPAVVYPSPDPDTLTRSYSNPYRQDTYRTAERRPPRTPQRPRQRRFL